MKDGCGFTPNIIDEIQSGDIEGDRMEGESCVTRRVIDELFSWNIQGDQK